MNDELTANVEPALDAARKAGHPPLVVQKSLSVLVVIHFVFGPAKNDAKERHQKKNTHEPIRVVHPRHCTEKKTLKIHAQIKKHYTPHGIRSWSAMNARTRTQFDGSLFLLKDFGCRFYER